MASSIVLSDNGVTSGSAGIKSTGGNDGVLLLQTTTSGGTATTAVTVDNAQNVGVGVTPNAWKSTSKALQVGTTASIRNESGFTAFGDNYYTNSSNQNIYVTTAASSVYYQTGGTHAWLNAASGSAGGTITFTQAMTLDASGSLLQGVTSSPSNANGPVFAGRTYNNQNVSSGTVTVTIAAGPSAGVIHIASYQNGVGTSMRQIPFAKHVNGTIVLATGSTAVVTADPIGSVTASSGNIAIAVTYNNTDLSYWINYLSLT